MPNDTTYFCIALNKSKTSIKYKGTWRQLESHEQLDKFISDHKAQIDTDKILIVAPANTVYNDFKFLIDILKKHDLMKFHLVAEK